MALIFNNKPIRNIVYNGRKVKRVIYNGVEVYTENIEKYLNINPTSVNLSQSGDSQIVNVSTNTNFNVT